MDTDPFILMGDVWFSHGAFDNHPHRGFETVTYVIEGAISHYDNLGNKGIIEPTEVLWMTAGKGIVHNEVPVDDKAVHVLQLWLNLPKTDKLVDASIQELKKENTPRKKLPGAEIIVYSGTVGGLTATTRNHSKVLMTEIRLEPYSTFSQELPADYNGFMVILEGKGLVGSNTISVQSGDVAWLQHEAIESEVRVESKDQSLRAVMFAGKPLREPMVAKGPFVMNSEEEVRQAHFDFRAAGQTFGVRADSTAPTRERLPKIERRTIPIVIPDRHIVNHMPPQLPAKAKLTTTKGKNMPNTNQAMTATQPGSAIPPDDRSRQLTHVSYDDPKLPQIGLVGDTYTLLVSGKDTAGKYCLIDMLIPPTSGPAPHRHDFEEMFTILEGEIEFTFRGKKVTVKAGDTVNVPANAPHFFKNASSKPARLLCMCTPAGQEEFFMAVGVPLATRTTPPPKPSKEEQEAFMKKAEALAPKYRTELLKP